MQPNPPLAAYLEQSKLAAQHATRSPRKQPTYFTSHGRKIVQRPFAMRR